MIPTIAEVSRRPSPTVTPQALAWHGGSLWIGSRDLRRIYEIEPETFLVRQELECPGIPWAAVSDGESIFFNLGEGENDDRYIWRFVPGKGFADDVHIACPEFTGSYLSYDGEHLYLSQWYNQRLVQLDASGGIMRSIDVGAEVSGHCYSNGQLYVLRGTEADGEHWRIAQLDLREETPAVRDVARVPFACRSLTFDGECFWSNHRAANETVSFTIPLGLVSN